MEIRVLPDQQSAAREAARLIAAHARDAVSTRGRFVVAFSGGKTPWEMLRALLNESVPWADVHVFQVDERIAPSGDPDRNLTHMREILLQPGALPQANFHPMPVEEANLEAAARQYSRTMGGLAGTPPVLDLVHLGLGADGHTASLVPGDPALDIADHNVALAGPYQNRRRMTLTYPVLNRSRRVLWLVTGVEKTAVLARLLVADPSIPAGRVRQEHATLITDVLPG